MRWIAYSLAVLLLASASLVASTAASPAQESPQTETREPEEDFVPTEKIPADSAISFPVDI